MTNEGIVVLAGSKIRVAVVPSCPEYAKAAREENKENIDQSNNLMKDILFKTPSGASSFVLGAPTNGNINIEWRTIDGKTLKDIENSNGDNEITKSKIANLREATKMISKVTLKRYIQRCDEVTRANDQTSAEELQEDILAALGSDLNGLKSGLSNYSVVGVYTGMSEDRVDFVKDAKRLRSRLQVELDKIQPEMESESKKGEVMAKARKLFISHSSKDKEFIEKFVEMLETIGMSDGNIVCTSVPGYGIPGGASIYDWLRNQFSTCELRVIFMLSKNYYSSATSLNEMGAAWITKSVHTLMLLPGFGFSEVAGCIDPRKIGISFDADNAELKHRLDELKDTLISEHALQSRIPARWEYHRDKFIKDALEIAAKRKTAGEESESEDGVETAQSLSFSDVDNSSHIPVETAFLLVYAASGNGQIQRIMTLDKGTEISSADKQFMADHSPRETARWQEALDDLVSRRWVKPAGSKGLIYELTRTGYDRADWLKDKMEIDTDKEPIEQLKEFDQ